MDNKEKVTEVDAVNVPFMIAEYASLRAEILKMVEIEHQLASGALLAVGAFLTIGLQPGKPASILLVYPLLAICLAAGWAHKDMRIRQAATYIRLMEEMTLEGKPIALGWGHFLKKERSQVGIRRTMGLLSASGVFLVTQIFTVGLAYSIGFATRAEWTLFAIDIGCIFGTYIILQGSPGWRKTTP